MKTRERATRERKKKGASLKPYLMVVSPTAFEGPRDGGYTRGSEKGAARLSTHCAAGNSNFSTMAEAKKEDSGAPEYKGKVNLVSSEGDKFEVDTKVAAMSELVKHAQGGRRGRLDGDEADDQAIPLPNVKSTVLAKVVEFCIYHTSNGYVP